PLLGVTFGTQELVLWSGCIGIKFFFFLDDGLDAVAKRAAHLAAKENSTRANGVAITVTAGRERDAGLSPSAIDGDGDLAAIDGQRRLKKAHLNGGGGGHLDVTGDAADVIVPPALILLGQREGDAVAAVGRAVRQRDAV